MTIRVTDVRPDLASVILRLGQKLGTFRPTIGVPQHWRPGTVNVQRRVRRWWTGRGRVEDKSPAEPYRLVDKPVDAASSHGRRFRPAPARAGEGHRAAQMSCSGAGPLVETRGIFNAVPGGHVNAVSRAQQLAIVRARVRTRTKPST